MAEKPKLTIEPGCITCGACEFIAPEVFQVTDRSYVKDRVEIEKHTSDIERAVRACPVQVIKFSK
jgi:ferredoxin